MLDNLTQRLAKVVKTMRGEARLTESNTADMLREVRLALLEEREQLREKLIHLNARANALLGEKAQLQQERIASEEERLRVEALAEAATAITTSNWRNSSDQGLRRAAV